MMKDFFETLWDTIGEGREDHRQAMWRAREEQGKDIEAPRFSMTMGTNPTFTRAREAVGLGKPEDVQARQDMGLGLSSDPMEKTAQLTGTVISDAIQDRSRGLWWLLNAPQAVVNVGQEQTLSKLNPDLFKSDPVMVDEPQLYTKTGVALPRKNKDKVPLKINTQDGYEQALAQDLIYGDRDNVRSKKGVQIGKGGTIIRRRHQPGHVDALMVPSGIAINAGIGLLNPFGGSGGYEAVLPQEDDKSKSSNVIGEIGAKYILGRTGNLMPYSEFKEHRPDVSKGEYNAYKAFKWDKNTDLDLSDGDFTAMLGAIKGTNDGIHGPEIQFLGRSMPLATTIMPTIATAAGVVAGARGRAPIRNGLAAGMGTFAISGTAGMAIENERRNRNERSHKASTPAIDPEGPVNYY